MSGVLNLLGLPTFDLFTFLVFILHAKGTCFKFHCLCHSFDDFLMDMKQNKRKNIRQERKKVSFFQMLFYLGISFILGRYSHLEILVNLALSSLFLKYMLENWIKFLVNCVDTYACHRGNEESSYYGTIYVTAIFTKCS